MRKAYELLIIAAILVFGIYLRLQLIPGGVPFFEPDCSIYFLKAEAILSHNLMTPPINPLSGYPTHFPYPERPGLGYLQVFTYLLLFKMVSLYDVMLALPVVFGILGMLLTYLLTKKLTDNQYVPFLAMLFFAMIPAAVFRTSATEFRGDSFVPILIMLPALLLPTERGRKEIIFILSTILSCVVALLMWSGGIYVIACMVVFYLFFIFLVRVAPLIKMPRNKIIIFKAIGIIILFSCILTFPWVISTHYGTSSRIIGEIMATSIAYLNGAYGEIIFFLALIYFILPVLFTNRVKDKQTYIYILSFFIITLGLQLWEQRWSDLLALSASIFAAMGAYEITKILKFDKVFYYGAILLILLITVTSSMLNIAVSLKTADFQTPNTIQTLTWIRNNTPQNATFLSLWPDGSLIEGIANRQSYTDSMAAANIYYTKFPQFLYAKEGNLSFIANVSGLDYIWIRQALLNESNSIKLMGNLSVNTTLNATNFAALEEGTNLTEGNISLHRVFKNSDGYVYKVN